MLGTLEEVKRRIIVAAGGEAELKKELPFLSDKRLMS